MKNKIFKISCSAVLVFAMLISSVMAAGIGGKTITSQGACVMDYETGEILYEYNGYTRRVPASMTKIMNLYCVYEALANGEIALDTIVPISQNVYNKSRNSVYQSVLPLYYNTIYTVDEMIDVIVTYSASGAAVAMAELIGGTESAFVERMNNKAQEMGIDAYYYDSCGIANNLITPVGMATLARNIIRDYPDILNRSSQQSVYFHGNRYKTTNHLLDTYYYRGADGLKTGTTSAAGYCFCGTAERNGNRVITVTMSSSSTGQRFVDTATLMDYGFSVINAKNNSIYFTDMKTFIDGVEMPTFAYKGTDAHAVIVAEDLQNYGFDISWNSELKTLDVIYNENKAVTPMPMTFYRNKNGQKAFDISRDTDITVDIDDGRDRHILEDVYNVGGYMCISVDEFQDIYDFVWDGNTQSINITTHPKKPRNIMPNGIELTSETACIMDYETGDILYSYDSKTQRPCASIAKMMSVYVMMDTLKNGEISLNTVVPISENVYNLSRVEDYKMMVNLEYDETYTVDEMIDMIVIDSAAACVTAMAELISGSEQEFVKLMNNKAEEIGIDSVFYNGTGVCLNPETDKENMMSAEEIAVMTKRMIEDYPEITERTKRASVNFHGKTYYNLNKMFTDYYYEGADGFKNGMTAASGYCMCGTAEIDGKRIITVTLPSDSNETRFTDTAKMFDYGFSVFGIDTSKSTDKDVDVITDGMDITVNIDGNYVMHYDEQKPVVINDRVFVPVRDTMETLNKTVDWDGATKQIKIYDDVTVTTLTIDSDVMIKETLNPIDGTRKTEEIKLDAVPVILNDVTCLPIRAVVEAFGSAVIWESETNTVLIIAGVC